MYFLCSEDQQNSGSQAELYKIHSKSYNIEIYVYGVKQIIQEIDQSIDEIIAKIINKSKLQKLNDMCICVFGNRPIKRTSQLVILAHMSYHYKKIQWRKLKNNSKTISKSKNIIIT